MSRRALPLLIACALAACTAEAGVRSQAVEPISPTSGSDTTVGHSTTTDPASETTAPATETTETPPDPSVDPDGVGDVLFPRLGNPGIDVRHYDVSVRYDPATDLLAGVVGADITLTADRDEITLDSVGLDIAHVLVDGQVATFQADDPELRIDVPGGGTRGQELRVEVEYSVEPTTQPSVVGLPAGWFNTPGGSYVLNEPDAASSWLPCNDHPSDKATFTFTITVPEGLTGVANGALAEHRTVGTDEVWVWQETRPMATYLVLLLTGDYEIIEGTGPHGLPLLSVVLRDDLATMQPYVDITDDQIAFFEQYFGPYPLDRYGIAMTDSFGGLAMEYQERSMFSREDFSSGELGYIEHLLLSHELAHQWFGDAVSPARWQDIWLNESFATYGQWLWMEEAGIDTVQNQAELVFEYRTPGATALPAAEDMFGVTSYDGGAIVLHALRLTIGDDAFFQLLQRWVADNNGTSRTTQDFTRLAEEVSGRQLEEFFDEWLFAEQPPNRFPRPTG
ncbi:MAG: M1 family metallopeptidase [Actinomycetota bacterium]|nr:M1 family metallopeptidase [Actinomycetota bacterium]